MLEAFSDGVLAVAITLMALNLVGAGPGHGRWRTSWQTGGRPSSRT